MRSRNYGVCHSCRSTNHFFGECQRRRRCPRCVNGIQKCFEVQKEGNNKGRLFQTCSNECGYFDLVKEEANGESSTVNEAINPTAKEEVDELLSMFESLARIAEKRNIEISLNVTFRKGKDTTEDNGKGKGPA